MSETEKQMAEIDNRKRGRVKWYNERRGYGFIEVDDHEVFIHRSTLQQFGIIRIQNEDIVLVSQVKTDRGYIVEHLFGIERPPLPDWLYASTPEEGEKMAEVKFFNEDKGYGFVMVEGYSQDIFIHSRTLEQNRITSLESGQKVLVKMVDDDEGPTIDSIRFYVGHDGNDTMSDAVMEAMSDATMDEDIDNLDDSSNAGDDFYDLTNEK